MTSDSIIKQTALQSPQGLAKVFEGICDIYRKRLCEQWDLYEKQSWWIPSDRPGITLAINDCEYSISIDDLRIFVDYAVSFDDFNEWWKYNVYAFDYKRHPINSYSWFVNGCRPEYLEY